MSDLTEQVAAALEAVAIQAEHIHGCGVGRYFGCQECIHRSEVAVAAAVARAIEAAIEQAQRPRFWRANSDTPHEMALAALHSSQEGPTP